MSGRVLVAGEALVDVLVDERLGSGADARTEHPGGSPLNVAVALARLGVATTLAAQVGDDAHGEAVAAHLTDSGVDLRRLPPSRRTSTATARLDTGGQATYEFDLVWDPDQLPDPHGFDVVHVGSIGTALAPGAGAVAGLVSTAAAAGVPVSVDPNVRPQVTPDLADVRLRIDQVTSAATLVKLSDEDAELLRPGVPIDRVLADLAAGPGVRLAVLTRGAGGLLLSTGGAAVAVSSPEVPVVDTIGAGDTVTAALIAGLLARELLAERASPVSDADASAIGMYAVAAAAVTCARPGADPPWEHELRGLDPAGSRPHP